MTLGKTRFYLYIRNMSDKRRTVRKVSSNMPASKKTWPIKGRGLGIITGLNYTGLLDRIVEGYRPLITIIGDSMVGISDDLGRTTYREYSRVKQDFDGMGLNLDELAQETV